MENIRKEFPVLQNQIYANTAVYGPISRGLIEWRYQHDYEFLEKGSDMRATTLAVISETRIAVGEFLGCKTENVSLVANFSSGLNMLLEGVNKKTKVLLLQNDYPSLNWPFESRDFSIFYAVIDDCLEENILKIIEKEKINVLAVSLVQWLDGIKIDLNFLKLLKSEYPDLIIMADATQFCGTVNFDFENSAIDVLGASSYKWLLSGYGSGFLIFKDEVKNRFSLKTIGFNATDADPSKKEGLSFARHFEPGHLSCLNFGSLKFSLDFLSAYGKDKIDKQNRILSKKAKEEFSALNLLQDAVKKREQHSTIFNIKGDDNLFQNLTNNKVVCSQRGQGIRLSFHFYNTENEIDAIVKIIKANR